MRNRLPAGLSRVYDAHKDKEVYVRIAGSIAVFWLVALLVTMAIFQPSGRYDYPALGGIDFIAAAVDDASTDAVGRPLLIGIRVAVLVLLWAFGYLALPKVLALLLLILSLMKGIYVREVLKLGYYGMLLTLILAISGAFLPAHSGRYLIGVFWTGVGGVVRDAFGDFVAWVVVFLLITLLLAHLRPFLSIVFRPIIDALRVNHGENAAQLLNSDVGAMSEEPLLMLHVSPGPDTAGSEPEPDDNEADESYSWDFNVAPDRPSDPVKSVYRFPSIDLLDNPSDGKEALSPDRLDEYRRKLEWKFDNLGVDVESIETGVYGGLVRFNVRFSPHVLIRDVRSLEKDIAMALAAWRIRISDPHPGQRDVLIDAHLAGVPGGGGLRSIVASDAFRSYRGALPVILGEDGDGQVQLEDLSLMPHLLVAAQSVSEKSSFLDGLVVGLLYACSPESVKFVFIEIGGGSLFRYGKLKPMFIPRIPEIDNPVIRDPEKALLALRNAVTEMDIRLTRMRRLNCPTHASLPSDQKFPYLVIMLDGISELMNARRDVEGLLGQLAFRGPSAGIHLVLSTQRPLAATFARIEGAGLFCRVVFRLDSREASKAVLGVWGAEQLHGHNEMMFRAAQSLAFRYVWGVRISGWEMERVLSFVRSQAEAARRFRLGGEPFVWGFKGEERDSAFDEAARLVVMSQQGSVSLLQRRLRLGFSRAGRLMDQLEIEGIVGPQDGSRPRDVLIADLRELEVLLYPPENEDW